MPCRVNPVSDTEPIVPFRQRRSDAAAGTTNVRCSSVPPARRISFDHKELNAILSLYGIMVAAGEWRDYAIDLGHDKAVFSVFRRTAEVPLYRIEKHATAARRQGAYAVVAQGGAILKHGQDLVQVLKVLVPRPKLVALSS
jgi:hypothetical protein